MINENNNMDLLKYAIDNGIINLSNIQKQVDMKAKEKYLKQHTYSIWHGKDGLWYTYLPDETKPRKKCLKKRTTEEAIQNLVVDFWKSKENNSHKIYTFDSVYFMWRKVQDQMVSENTVAKYETDYNRFFKHTKIIETSLGKESTRKFFGYIRNTFLTAKKKKIITENPMEFLAAKDFYKYCVEKFVPIEKKIVSDTDMRKLQIQFKEDHETKPNYIPTYAVEFATLTGMRVGEIAALTWEDITDKYIIIRKSEKSNRQKNSFYIDSTKNKKIRLFPMTNEIKTLLRTVKKVEIQYGYFCEWVFANENGRLHSHVISYCSKTKCRQLGIDEKGIHAFRRTLNSKMRCMGVPVTVAASMLGHTSDVNNKYYTFDITSMDEKTSIVEKINRQTKMYI